MMPGRRLLGEYGSVQLLNSGSIQTLTGGSRSNEVPVGDDDGALSRQ